MGRKRKNAFFGEKKTTKNKTTKQTNKLFITKFSTGLKVEIAEENGMFTYISISRFPKSD